jgi:hypothetical protein
MSTPGRCHLLRLPLECRQSILEHALASEEPLNLLCLLRQHYEHWYSCYRSFGVLTTCKQLHREGLEVLYRTRIFQTYVYPIISPMICDPPTTLPPSIADQATTLWTALRNFKTINLVVHFGMLELMGLTLNEILRTLCGATAGPSKVIIIDFEGDLWTTDLYMMLETLESLELWLEENENIWLRLRGQHMTRYPYIYDERYVDVDDANEQKWLSFLRAYESRFLPPDGLHHSVEYYG